MAAEHDDHGRTPRARRRGQGELEAMVLSALGDATTPVPVGWVQRRLGEDLSYSTVITILTRLHEKGAVTRTGPGRPVLWQSLAVDEADLTALSMRRLLDRQDNRDAVLSSFVSALSSDDEDLLRSLLNDAGPGSPAAPAAEPAAPAPEPAAATAEPAAQAPEPAEPDE
ncbi:BlaI/MecI/CopY family transcriptional regulator [Streptomyces sp. NBC_01506]|uniref:BlaI/MecI/CopY family transcriptional regulator n=1 Tax=Streptomyces sp. NBC_01506 TaxID=2903887 RepID=UPI003865DD10